MIFAGLFLNACCGGKGRYEHGILNVGVGSGVAVIEEQRPCEWLWGAQDVTVSGGHVVAPDDPQAVVAANDPQSKVNVAGMNVQLATSDGPELV